VATLEGGEVEHRELYSMYNSVRSEVQGHYALRTYWAFEVLTIGEFINRLITMQRRHVAVTGCI
jgi:hypothetical protein